MNFKIKICGITSTDDALAALDAGADAIGLNFYSESKRCIDLAKAREIVNSSLCRASAIGVFVNESAERIREICNSTGIKIVQLHGNEPPEFLQLLGDAHDIIRARRLEERGLSVIADDLQACCKHLGRSPFAVLVDAAAPGHFGGSGQTVDWRQLTNYESQFSVPLILAGGLTPDNIAEAIRIVRPYAVDVASGVESSPGKKDAAKMRDFVAAARAAFAAL